MGVEQVIIIDTTMIYSDPNLRGTTWRVLEALAEDGEVEVVVPEVVIRESINHRRKQFSELKMSLHKLVKQSASFGISLELPVISEGDVIEAYEAHLRSSVNRMGRMDPLPTAGHEALVDRAISKRKPFDQSGRGYRDALVWESVAGAAGEKIVVLVTDNHSDFCASANAVDGYRSLHGDLVDDLIARGIAANTVRVTGSLDTLIECLVGDPARWLRERAGDEATRLLDAVLENRLADVIRGAVAAHLEDVWLDDGIEIMTTHRADDLVLHEIGDIGDFYVNEATSLPPDQLLGVVVVKADIVVGFSVEVYFDGEWLHLDRYMEPTSVNLRVGVKLNEDTGEFKITSIEGPFGGYIETYD